MIRCVLLFMLTLSSTLLVGAPQIAVTINGLPVVAGSVTPEIANGTNLGTSYVNSVVWYRVFIINTGTETLNISGRPISGPNANQFVQSTSDFSPTVAPGFVTEFTLIAVPTTVGEKNATLTINSNASVSAFSFAIRTTAVEERPDLPDIYLSGPPYLAEATISCKIKKGVPVCITKGKVSCQNNSDLSHQPARVTVWFSSDPYLDLFDTFVVSKKLKRLQFSKVKNAKLKHKLVGGSPTGGYYLIQLDPENLIPEVVKGNNFAIMPALHSPLE